MTQLNRTQSKRLFEESSTLFPGGVNSPVRAFKSVGGTPLVLCEGERGFRVGRRWKPIH